VILNQNTAHFLSAFIYFLGLLQFLPAIMCRSQWSKAWTVFARLDRGFVAHSRDGCLCAFILCLCCSVCRYTPLRGADHASKESYGLCIGSKNRKGGQGPAKDCRVIISWCNKMLHWWTKVCSYLNKVIISNSVICYMLVGRSCVRRKMIQKAICYKFWLKLLR
jgi:hypothetical protein